MTNTKPQNVPGTRLKSMFCPVCNSSQWTVLSKAYDDRYGHPDDFELVQCCTCGHIATSPQLSEADLPSLYGNYYPRKSLTPSLVMTQAANVTAPWARISRWIMGTDNQGQYHVAPGEKILDVGCGSGVSLLEAQALGAEAFGIEADPNVAPLSKALNLKIHFGNMADQPFPEVDFDLIILNQVIEHIPEPDKTLCLLASRLSENGRILLVFPNRDSFWCKISGIHWINWHIPYHQHHFNKQGLVQLALRNGLKPVCSRTITPNIWTILQLRAATSRTAHGTPNPMWHANSTSSDITPKENNSISAKKVIKRIIFAIALLPITIANRTIDLFGMGDSLMIELKKDKQA